MTSTKITIPDFDFASFYYPEILDALINFKRQNVPEMTDETPYEPLIQLLRAFALVGHLNNTTLDLIANEAYLSSAKLVESVREHLRLIDYQMKPAVPAQSDIVFELSRAIITSTEILPENSLFSTEGNEDEPAVFFEVLDSHSVADTNVFSYVFSKEDTSYTDHTASANAQATPWSPWTDVASGDEIYYGHSQIMWNKMVFDIDTPSSGISGIYEFYGNHHYKTTPGLVTDQGATLDFNVNSILGTENRAGSSIRITLNSTGAYEDVFSTWDGSDNIASTTGLLGQSIVSEEETDYTLSRDWYELSGVTDSTLDLTVDDESVEFTLPQSVTEYWQKTEINDVNAYWIRYRVISVSTPTEPVLDLITIDEGKQYYLASATQGQTQLDDPLGSSNGQANQSFDASREYFVLNSDYLEVENEEWFRVDDFLSSSPTNKHYTVTLGDNDRATFTFGDGNSGSIPPIGVNNISCEYRYNAELDGNVGYNTITSDKTGLVYVNSLWNPRQASGWSASQGSDEQSLEKAKIEGPASLRIKEVALNGDDAAVLAVSYIDDDGTSPFTRATAFEGTYGPKTIELVVVASGGTLASTEQLQSVEDYFNGDKTADPPKPKRIVANQELSAVNYSQKTIDVTATVYGNVESEAVKNSLIRILQPEALDEDGISYVWNFGGEVSVSRLNHEIFKLDDSIWKVEISIPANDVQLASRELPIYGTINITVVKGTA